ncbi:MAG: 23S rRNA (pseudouridine(1915)-N(3))-methyltransferase RlmH [Lachnospiraceae bacterium]|nr:23S rRNA (pseudouridine(1915)-N(3))-methyltransferase RlmH [Lachnospiraceae bacterium]MBR6486499.1 23S rRNA (pseudouridine(1915)-N(3))-methyltransferase RlmH [Lachnospiraceae bacterium]
MNIDILCVGRLKEDYLKDAVNEYVKRLKKYCRINIIESLDEKAPEGQGSALDIKARQLEGSRIIRHIKDDAVVICLEIEGVMMSSEVLAGVIKDAGINGKSNIQFVIGGSLGLSDEVISRADIHLSFSKMTFPHQLMRVILLEQIYRSFKINANEPYHK